MVFENLKVSPKQRATAMWANAVVDGLELVYWLGKRGDPDNPFNMFYGFYGFFDQALFVQGKPVIKDGDPISLYDIFSYAQQKITSAIDSARITSISDLIRLYTQESRDVLLKIYGKVPSTSDITYAVDYSSLAANVSNIRDKVVRLRMDDYGNVGIIIAEPVDEYGRVKVSPPSELIDEFKPVSASASVAAADNTAGLVTTLFKGGRPNINIFYSLGGAGNIYVEVSLDGSTWRLLETITLSAAGSGTKIYQGIAYPYVRARTDATGIDVAFEIVASR